MRIFNLAEELEKERKKNKELEKQLNCKKEYTKYLPEDVELIILTKPDYDRQQEELLDKVFELEKELKEADETVEYWQKECDKRNKVLDKIKDIYENSNKMEYKKERFMQDLTLADQMYKLLEEIE